MILAMTDLQQLIGMQLGRRMIPPGARLLSDLGVDSFDMVNILARIEERSGICLEEVDISDALTVAGLHAMIQEKLLSCKICGS